MDNSTEDFSIDNDNNNNINNDNGNNINGNNGSINGDNENDNVNGNENNNINDNLNDNENNYNEHDNDNNVVKFPTETPTTPTTTTTTTSSTPTTSSSSSAEKSPNDDVEFENNNYDSPSKKPKHDHQSPEPQTDDVVELNDIGLPLSAAERPRMLLPGSSSKKKRKSANLWVMKAARKGKKKGNNGNNGSNGNHSGGGGSNGGQEEERMLVIPAPRVPDKTDDTPEMLICLSKVYKAEKVELSEDRLSAGSTKGYRMVRATRGVSEGAWYFEIKVVHLGVSGHTRLGWCTEKGDLQAPVGYDANGFAFRDIDGSKIHKAWREKYAEEGYKEGDVIGCYISLPDGGLYAPKPPKVVMYKGQRYFCVTDPKEDPPKVVPGSVISFFKNGICQGVAFKELFGGRYYPAASMYTLPNQPNCEVRFNFGPDFDCFPEDFGGHPVPKPLTEVPYQGADNQEENNSPSEENKQTQ